MARTRLMRALQRLAREHQQAERLGISPAELRQREADASEHRYSRGAFLKRSGAAGAAIAIAGPAALARPAGAANGPRIAIVGGGIAGLTAALMLQDKGVASTVYEAHPSRVGGRMHSDWSEFPGYWADGQVAELCGELIDSGHKTILGLAQRFRLKTVNLTSAEPRGSEDTYYFDNAYYPKDQADRDFQPVHKALQRDVSAASYPTTYFVHNDAGIALDRMSVYEWIESLVPGGHASPFGQVLDIAYTIEYGAETEDQSALNLVYLLGYKSVPGNYMVFGASNERYHIVGGNALLPLAIRDALSPETVKTSWRLESIKRNADGSSTMSFDTPSGAKPVTADHVILALPFAVLRTLDYKGADFEPLKRTAIADLGAGRNSKLQLQFAARLWNTSGPWGLSNGASYSDTGYQNTWDVTRGQNGARGILVDYTGGDVAGALSAGTPYANAANGKVVTLAQRFLKQLEPVFPEITKQWNGRVTLSTPMLDPNLNCSYSYWKVGQYVGFSGWEGLRQGNIHFAGEHCSQDFQGYMEGGASTGVAAANEILADLKRA
ncbi:MAG TPA: NAD(P)/FAD-dependent oxidoreductase [Gaiellaceae bacterium]